MHFSLILGLGVSIADFGSEVHVFESQPHHFFFIGKIVGVTEIRTHGPQIQSQLYLPLDHWDRVFWAKKLCIKFYILGDATTTPQGKSVGK